MPIRLRGSTYWIDINHNGKRIRQSAGTSDPKKAQELHDRLKADLWEHKHLGKSMPRTFAQAVDKWLKENTEFKSMRDRSEKLVWLLMRIGNMKVQDVDERTVEHLIEQKQGEGVSNATVNRHMSALSVILNCCETWGWIDRAPRVRSLKETKSDGKFYTREMVVKLVAELPMLHACIFSFALATGQRMSNILNLRWDKVDLDKGWFWISAGEFKSNKDHNVPLNKEALAILEMLQGQHEVFVFVGRGNKPIKRMSGDAWYGALDRAGIPHGARKGFTFHHTRHTWASFHTMNGTPKAVLQELGGWKTSTMPDRYSHLAPGHAASFAGNSTIKR